MDLHRPSSKESRDAVPCRLRPPFRSVYPTPNNGQRPAALMEANPMGKHRGWVVVPCCVLSNSEEKKRGEANKVFLNTNRRRRQSE